ncbi:MAG: hypothetical protein KF760_27985 [Candidatus Eremiobacteraeota bacterium]|nr:hypothetical protein [Candidatus Eremiobacteraeota bacterium]MCW5871484.1 hypothetical protein [Candidatus Eremiobacteraeota bacterium]
MKLLPFLDGVVLYGGVLRGRYQAHSDVNLLLLLNDSSAPALRQLELPLTAARRSIRLAPMILESAEVARVADVFPVKMLDIQRHHLLLWGQANLQDLRIDPEHIRLHLEQGLRNIQLRLRVCLAAQAHDGLSLRRHLLGLARPLAIHMQELMLLLGLECPSDKTLAIYQAAASHWRLCPVPLQQLGNLRQEAAFEFDPVLLAGELFPLLHTVVDIADRCQVKS